MFHSPTTLKITLRSWNKEDPSKSLFDYQGTSADYKKQEEHITQPIIMLKNHYDDLFQIMAKEECYVKINRHQGNYTQLFTVETKYAGYHTELGACNDYIVSFPYRCWNDTVDPEVCAFEGLPFIYILGHAENHPQYGYELKPGNVIKMANKYMKVVEMGVGEQDWRMIYRNHPEKHFLAKVMGTFEAAERLEQECKYCLQGEESESNWLIKPCMCRGNMDAVHTQCLKDWMQNRYGQNNIQRNKCELCHFQTPGIVTRGNRIIQMREIERPASGPYIIFEQIHNTQANYRKTLRRSLGIFKFLNNRLFVGRNPQADICLAQNAISDAHCEFTYNNGKFYLRDLQSRYGTLVRVEENIRIRGGKGSVRVQLGNDLFSFKCTGPSYKQLKEKNLSQKQEIRKIYKSEFKEATTGQYVRMMY